MSFDSLAKGAKTLILIVLISAIAAGILTIYIWTQPMFIEMLAQGNYWFLLTTFMAVWMIASLLAWLLVFCVTRKPKGSVPQTIGD